MRRGPLPDRIAYLTSSGVHETVDGWKSSHALGVLKIGAGFASVMLLPGQVIEEGFPTLALAHAFNEQLLAARNMLVGAVDLNEFFEKAGGAEEARAVVAQIKAKVLKQEVKK